MVFLYIDKKMKQFDLHPKAATSARKKTVIGGILTSVTVIIALILLYFRAKVDFGRRTEDVRINDIAHDETMPIEFDVYFTEVSSCLRNFQVEVLDALHRPVKDPQAKITVGFWNRACRIYGTIHVPAGKGTFRIYPAAIALENIHANHRIYKLLVATELPGVPYEARSLKTETATSTRSGAWSYFLSLVPTTSNGVHGYQIAATRTFVEMSNPLAARGSLYFYYESSPVRMHLDSRLSFSKFFHFAARALGIISGLFAFVGASRELFVNLLGSSKKKKPTLVM